MQSHFEFTGYAFSIQALYVFTPERVITMFEFLLTGGDLLGEQDKCSLVALELTASPSC